MNVIVFVFAFATNPLQVHASFVHEVHDQVDSAVGMVWYAIALILRVDVSCGDSHRPHSDPTRRPRAGPHTRPRSLPLPSPGPSCRPTDEAGAGAQAGGENGEGLQGGVWWWESRGVEWGSDVLMRTARGG